jgi:hypothetical protein
VERLLQDYFCFCYIKRLYITGVAEEDQVLDNMLNAGNKRATGCQDKSMSADM